jgi:hypothetical protein
MVHPHVDIRVDSADGAVGHHEVRAGAMLAAEHVHPFQSGGIQASDRVGVVSDRGL